MADEAHPFTPGTEVSVERQYSHYNRGTFSADKVLKLHKTGRFTLTSDPKQQWEAWQNRWDDKDRSWYARPTGRSGYSIYHTRARLMDDAARVEIVEVAAKREHEKRCEKIAKAFAKPKDLPPELSAKIIEMLPIPETTS